MLLLWNWHEGWSMWVGLCGLVYVGWSVWVGLCGLVYALGMLIVS